ncbi:hypothetical protein CXG81DRAFT_17541 [Caulochytrium protostelioides]|uniref:Periplasmic binding protein-like II n=1 Tax=Caulochytrium protostelioides TaxID=1555241 RepID=A0A4P9XBQ8_9FUNG|nr:periplasmic binding protein-like II [Caulochytrium protostelioides]RKP02822.1 hypothetical protein CXG81DRAFT_17541 [Caulochytrium protostelioides]|eukprot:RKP02822.1 hypothetical protein CXG81DRAFT_17541 [Caulochytrium protostelioides]
MQLFHWGWAAAALLLAAASPSTAALDAATVTTPSTTTTAIATTAPAAAATPTHVSPALTSPAVSVLTNVTILILSDDDFFGTSHPHVVQTQKQWALARGIQLNYLSVQALLPPGTSPGSDPTTNSDLAGRAVTATEVSRHQIYYDQYAPAVARACEAFLQSQRANTTYVAPFDIVLVDARSSGMLASCLANLTQWDAVTQNNDLLTQDATLLTAGMVNGSLVTLPFNHSLDVMTYNEPLLLAHYAAPPASEDELYLQIDEVLGDERVLEHYDLQGYSGDFATPEGVFLWMSQIMASNATGSPLGFFDAMGNVTITSQHVVDAASKIMNMVIHGYMDATVFDSTVNVDGGQSTFLQGDALFWQAEASYVTTMGESRFSVGAANLPWGNMSVYRGYGVGLFAGSAVGQAGIDVLEYLSSVAHQKDIILMTRGYHLPTHPSLFNDADVCGIFGRGLCHIFANTQLFIRPSELLGAQYHNISTEIGAAFLDVFQGDAVLGEMLPLLDTRIRKILGQHTGNTTVIIDPSLAIKKRILNKIGVQFGGLLMMIGCVAAGILIYRLRGDDLPRDDDEEAGQRPPSEMRTHMPSTTAAPQPPTASQPQPTRAGFVPLPDGETTGDLDADDTALGRYQTVETVQSSSQEKKTAIVLDRTEVTKTARQPLADVVATVPARVFDTVAYEASPYNMTPETQSLASKSIDRWGSGVRLIAPEDNDVTEPEIPIAPMSIDTKEAVESVPDWNDRASTHSADPLSRMADGVEDLQHSAGRPTSSVPLSGTLAPYPVEVSASGFTTETTFQEPTFSTQQPVGMVSMEDRTQPPVAEGSDTVLQHEPPNDSDSAGGTESNAPSVASSVVDTRALPPVHQHVLRWEESVPTSDAPGIPTPYALPLGTRFAQAHARLAKSFIQAQPESSSECAPPDSGSLVSRAVSSPVDDHARRADHPAMPINHLDTQRLEPFQRNGQEDEAQFLVPLSLSPRPRQSSGAYRPASRFSPTGPNIPAVERPDPADFHADDDDDGFVSIL